MTAAVRNRLLLLVALAAVAAAFFGLGLHKHLTLSAVKEQQLALRELYAAHPLAVLGGYFALYVLVVSLNLPGAAALSLVGGAVFGFVVGVVVVSFASSIGATLACALARYMLRDWVQARFGARLAKINEGVAREGIFYLFFLRLVPAFPFFLVNLAMGLTPMRLTTFYWVSQLGMLPGTLVFLNAGVQLGALESLSGVFSPKLLLSFALLGVFPLIAKRLIAAFRPKA